MPVHDITLISSQTTNFILPKLLPQTYATTQLNHKTSSHNLIQLYWILYSWTDQLTFKSLTKPPTNSNLWKFPPPLCFDTAPLPFLHTSRHPGDNLWPLVSTQENSFWNLFANPTQTKKNLKQPPPTSAWNHLEHSNQFKKASYSSTYTFLSHRLGLISVRVGVM